MAKTKISEYSATASSNTDINSINLAEGMAPSLVNNAIRQLMAQLKDFQAGTAGDNVTVGGNLAVTGTSAFTGAISAPMTAGTIDGVPIGGTTTAAGAFTTLAASGTTTLAGALVGAVTQAAFNTTSTTLNLGGAATAVNIGAATGTATVANTTLAAKAITASTTLAVTGASTLTGAVTASSTLAVTGAATLSSTLAVTGTSTLTGAVTATAGVTGPITSSNATITGGSVTGITDLAVADGGTGASTAANARTNLSAATSGANSDITSITGLTTALTVLQGGTGVTTSTGSGNVVLSTSPTLVTPLLGTPTSGVATNLTGLPISTGVSGLGTGVATFLATPSSANLISAVTDETGTGALVFATSPTLVTPILGTPTSGTLTNATGLPISTGVAGLGTGVATFLATPSSANLAAALTDETGSGANVFATSPTLVTPLLGTPTSGVATNLTGLPLTTGVTGTLPIANGGTGLTTTPANGALDIGNGTGFTRATLTAGSNVTITNASGAITIAASSGGGTPGGSTTQVQYNNAGAFGGITGATTNGTALTLVAPVLGTPASATLTNATGLPISTGVSGLGTNVATFLATPTSANLAAALTDETGSGANVFATSPTLVTPTLGVATATSLQGIIGNVTPAAGTFTTVTASTTGAVGTFTTTQTSGTAVTINVDGGSGTPEGLRVMQGIPTLSSNAKLINVVDSAGGSLFYARASGVIGVASGVDFPSTQVASASANCLDDYEEGTFTPTVIGTTVAGTASYSVQTGVYTKIGQLVSVACRVDYSGGTGSGNLRISGLPFTASNTFNRYGGLEVGDISLGAGNYAVGSVESNTTKVVISTCPTGGGAGGTAAYDSSGYIIFNSTYYV